MDLFWTIILAAVVIVLLVPDARRFIRDMTIGWRYGLHCPKCGRRVKSSMSHWDGKKEWICQHEQKTDSEQVT